MKKDLEIDFEYAVRQFLGKKAYGIAGMMQNESSFRRELRKCVSVMRKQIDRLDTTIRHRERLMHEVEELDDLLKAKKSDNQKEIIVQLFWLVSRLLGFDAVSGLVYNQPFYHQHLPQFIDEQVSWGKKKHFGDTFKEHKENIITLRKETYRILKNKRLSDQVIAGVLGTSEYQIKKLKHDI